jgi:hypothetical protein
MFDLLRRRLPRHLNELADPMQSETVKGWLLSNLRTPK